jgi:hypothetical protein
MKQAASGKEPEPASNANSAGNSWFLDQNQPAANNYVTFNSQMVAPGSNDKTVTSAQPTAEEEALAHQAKIDNSLPQVSYAHMHTIQPLSGQASQQASAGNQQLPAQQYSLPPVPSQQQTAADTTGQPPAASANDQPAASSQTVENNANIAELARNNDLDVATIARQASKKRESGDEVVISLH